MTTTTKYIFALLAFSLAPAVIANQDTDRDQLGEKLSDCGAFFGLLSQASTKQAEIAKNFSTASIAYAQTAFNDDGKFMEATRVSTQKAATFVSELKKTNDRKRFEDEFKFCISTLETAENTLRNEMPEISKSIVPELFK